MEIKVLNRSTSAKTERIPTYKLLELMIKRNRPLSSVRRRDMLANITFDHLPPIVHVSRRDKICKISNSTTYNRDKSGGMRQTDGSKAPNKTATNFNKPDLLDIELYPA